jgi:lysine 2,3-aminomutase
MDRWQKSLKECITDPDELAERFGVDPEPLRETAAIYPIRITQHYLSLIERPGDPIWLQCVPDLLELRDLQNPDPLDEERLSPVPGLIHRYPDRVVWLISGDCAVYCRFCMRKRRLACGAAKPTASVEEVATYLESRPEIRDVLISGGDPLLLSDDFLDFVLARLRKVPHLDIIRIGTRVPVTLPERITPRLCRILKKHHPLYVNTHFNHPREVTAASAAACGRLADAGIPLGNQTVLLRGVNDTPTVMDELVRSLLKIRVRPYYLHQMDLVRGTGHFRTTVAAGLEILESLRGKVSGMAIPEYVIDAPGGKGKIPLLPEYVRKEGDRLILRNYEGETVEYRDPEE